MPFVEIADTLFRLMIQMVPSMFIGLYLANILAESGYLERAGILMAPFSKGARLPAGCSSVLTLCLLDKDAAFSMLSQLNRISGLSGKEVIIVSMLASLPVCVRPAVFFVAPVSVSVLGLATGSIFTSVYFLIQLVKTVIGMSVGRMMFKSVRHMPGMSEAANIRRYSNRHGLLKSSIVATLPPFRRILIIVIPSLLIATVLIKSGAVAWLSQSASPVTRMLCLPPASGLVIISGLSSMMLGISTAGPLVVNGDLTSVEAVRTLLITLLFHSLYSTVRMSLPVNISLFGPKLGVGVTGIAGLLELTTLPVLAAVKAIDQYMS